MRFLWSRPLACAVFPLALAVAQEPTAAKADGVLRIVRRCRDDIEGFIHNP